MIRFAIWAAVSTKEQAAPDKISLDNQVERCRGAALARGWLETAGPYIAAGASRSFYVDLSVAEANIPALKELLDAAHANRYDVLMVYSYDRLGDVTEMVAQSLRFDNVQLYSLTQAVEPQPPEKFDPYNAEAEGIMRDVSRITQRFRIDDLRRKYRIGIPERARRGLTPLRVPYGYIWTGKKTAPRRDPVASAVILRIRDEFMAGKSLRSIAMHLAADGIPSPRGCPRWVMTTIRYILANPYYAGIVTIGKSTRIHDPRRKNRSRLVSQPESNWESSPGLHDPLWDAATRRAIQAEIRRRMEHNKNYRVRFPLSGLLTCGMCGQKVYRLQVGHEKPRKRVMACRIGGTSHVCLEYNIGVDLISRTLATALASRTLNPLTPSDAAPSNRSDQALSELSARRKRIQDGYETGLYTHIEAAEKLSTLQKQIETLQEQERLTDQSAHAWDDWQQLLASQPELYEHFPEWIRSEEPTLVNRLLTSILETIIIHHDNTVEIVWRK